MIQAPPAEGVTVVRTSVTTTGRAVVVVVRACSAAATP